MRITRCKNAILVYVETDSFFLFFFIVERIFNDDVLNSRQWTEENRYFLVSREIPLAITAYALSYYVPLDETRATQIRTPPLVPSSNVFFFLVEICFVARVCNSFKKIGSNLVLELIENSIRVDREFWKGSR